MYYEILESKYHEHKASFPKFIDKILFLHNSLFSNDLYEELKIF